MDLFAQSTKVPLSAELIRVSKMPRRSWTPEQAEAVACELTEVLRTPHGTQTLRPIQAVALCEIGTVGGLLGVMSVGSGKTLTSFLAGEVSEATRPLLLVPAALVGKTERDMAVLRQHWHFPEFTRVRSFELLGRAQAAELLEELAPDLIVIDECHRVRNLKAAVSRRVRRFFAKHPEVKCVALSGTMTKRSLHDYAHLARWCLPADGCPLPTKFTDLEFWADALDERKEQLVRAEPGALKILCNEDEAREWDMGAEHSAARKAFRRRLIETSGVVATYETAVDASLTIQAVEPPASPVIDAAFQTLRTWETPDGWPIADGLSMFRHAREVSLGFYYVWDPRPPQHWLDARRQWCSFVRQTLKHSHKLDSELQVRRAYPDAPELQAWKAVEKDFTPNTHAVWLDDSVLGFVSEWARDRKGIVWTEHQCFGDRLARDFGLPYFGKKGVNKEGLPVEQHPAGEPLVASIQSNSTGRNLQAWSTNLVTSPPPNGQGWEQLLGRTHREGQEADEVYVDVLMSCLEHVGAFDQALKDSRYVFESTGAPQKLLLAGINVLGADDIVFREGARWQK